MMAFSGVRSSWLMLARKRDLACATSLGVRPALLEPGLGGALAAGVAHQRDDLALLQARATPPPGTGPARAAARSRRWPCRSAERCRAPRAPPAVALAGQMIERPADQLQVPVLGRAAERLANHAFAVEPQQQQRPGLQQRLQPRRLAGLFRQRLAAPRLGELQRRGQADRGEEHDHQRQPGAAERRRPDQAGVGDERDGGDRRGGQRRADGDVAAAAQGRDGGGRASAPAPPADRRARRSWRSPRRCRAARLSAIRNRSSRRPGRRSQLADDARRGCRAQCEVERQVVGRRPGQRAESEARPPRRRASRPRPSACVARSRRRPASCLRKLPLSLCRPGEPTPLRVAAARRLNPEAIHHRGPSRGRPGDAAALLVDRNGFVSGRRPCWRPHFGDCEALSLPSSLAVSSPPSQGLASPEPPHQPRRAMLDAQKRSFLRMVSHELRTPLNSIIGFSEIISRELCGPLGSPQYVEYADHIRLSAA